MNQAIFTVFFYKNCLIQFTSGLNFSVFMKKENFFGKNQLNLQYLFYIFVLCQV